MHQTGRVGCSKFADELGYEEPAHHALPIENILGNEFKLLLVVPEGDAGTQHLRNALSRAHPAHTRGGSSDGCRMSTCQVVNRCGLWTGEHAREIYYVTEIYYVYSVTGSGTSCDSNHGMWLDINSATSAALHIPCEFQLPYLCCKAYGRISDYESDRHQWVICMNSQYPSEG